MLMWKTVFDILGVNMIMALSFSDSIKLIEERSVQEQFVMTYLSLDSYDIAITLLFWMRL